MKKILIVEDERTLRRDIAEVLEFEQYQTIEAENGREGLEQARQYLPDLIICDIFMPEVDGYSMLEALRQDQSTASIPFIFLSAVTDKMDIERGIQLGADGYIAKPFTIAELLEAVRQWA